MTARGSAVGGAGFGGGSRLFGGLSVSRRSVPARLSDLQGGADWWCELCGLRAMLARIAGSRTSVLTGWPSRLRGLVERVAKREADLALVLGEFEAAGPARG